VPATVIFNAALTTSFKASKSFMLVAGRATLDFDVEVTAGTGDPEVAGIEWYLEFASDDPNDPATQWFREIAEQNLPGPGTTDMPKVVRVFREVDGTLLLVGEHTMSAQLSREHEFCRVQIRAASGTARALILSVFGSPPLSPQLAS
jgi:hypothetical protein